MTAIPSAFGSVSDDIPPTPGCDVNDHRYRAAIMQHRIACSVQASLTFAETSLPRFLKKYTELPGLSLDRQRRVLRGETSTTFADLVFWAAHFPSITTEVTKYLQTFQQTPPPQKEPSVRPPAPVAPRRPPLR